MPFACFETHVWHAQQLNLCLLVACISVVFVFVCGSSSQGTVVQGSSIPYSLNGSRGALTADSFPVLCFVPRHLPCTSQSCINYAVLLGALYHLWERMNRG